MGFESNIKENQEIFLRVQSTTASIEVLICIILFFLLLKEIIQFAKKIYGPLETDSLQKKYEENTCNMIQAPQNVIKSAATFDANNGQKEEEDSEKKGIFYRACRNVERFGQRLPFLAIIVVNVVYLSTYEFMAVVSYIMVVLSFLRAFFHKKLKTAGIIIEVIVVLATIAAYINVYVTLRIPELQENSQR